MDPAKREQFARQAANQGAIVVEPGPLDFGACANLAPHVHDNAADNLDTFVFGAGLDGQGQDVQDQRNADELRRSTAPNDDRTGSGK